MQRLVDTHVHVWDRRRLKLPWLEQVPALDRDWTPAEWKDALPDGDVVRGVYMEVDADEGDQGRELDLIAELMSDPRAGLVAAVAPGDPSVADLDDRIEFCAGIPRIRGFRSVLHTERSPRGTCLEPAFLRGVRRLGDADLHFELCMRVSELSDAVTLAEQAPDTMLVLDHLGNPPVGDVDLRAWREDLARLADCPNMVCKVSGLMQNTLPDWTEDRMLEIIAHARSCFGVDRLLFGGNWPVCTIAGSLKSWIEIVQRATASWSESERDALFADNAERFYRIDSTA